MTSLLSKIVQICTSLDNVGHSVSDLHCKHSHGLLVRSPGPRIYLVIYQLGISPSSSRLSFLGTLSPFWSHWNSLQTRVPEGVIYDDMSWISSQWLKTSYQNNSPVREIYPCIISDFCWDRDPSYFRISPCIYTHSQLPALGNRKKYHGISTPRDQEL